MTLPFRGMGQQLCVWARRPRLHLHYCGSLVPEREWPSVLFCFLFLFLQCQRLVLLFWLVPGSHEPVKDGEVTETLYLTNRAARGFT